MRESRNLSETVAEQCCLLVRPPPSQHTKFSKVHAKDPQPRAAAAHTCTRAHALPLTVWPAPQYRKLESPTNRTRMRQFHLPSGARSGGPRVLSHCSSTFISRGAMHELLSNLCRPHRVRRGHSPRIRPCEKSVQGLHPTMSRCCPLLNLTWTRPHAVPRTAIHTDQRHNSNCHVLRFAG